MKQNAQTNQTKPTNKSNETQTNPRPNAHTWHNREIDRKRKRECERERKRGSDLWWLTERFETGTVAISSRSGGGVDERQQWRRGVESELGRFFNLGIFCCLRFLIIFVFVFLFFFFLFFFFIYTKPGAAFYKTQLRMNWSCVLLTVAL